MSTTQAEYQQTFKALYYDLYSNGNSSRAERIVSDVTKLLLCKLACEDSHSDIIERYISGSGNFDNFMLPVIKDKYPQLFLQFDEFSFDEATIRHSLRTLSNITLKKAPAHVIGDAFQAIIGPRIRGDKGQFFTPINMVQCMVQIIDPGESDIIIDPACGTGGFLCESFLYSESKHSASSSKYIGIDKDKDMSDLAQTLMEIVDGGSSEIYNFNSLEIVNNDHHLNKYIGQTDIVLTNPPFGAKIGITDESILRQYDFGHNWAYSQKEDKWYMLDSVCKSQLPQILFVELGVRLLKAGGKMAIVLPEGVFGNSSFGYVWDYLFRNGKILAMIDCPRNTFQPSTDTKTNILFYQKGLFDENESTWVAVAKYCGHDKRGRIVGTNGLQVANDFAKISDSYTNRNESEFWYEARLNKKYFVPRYYIAQKESHALSTLGDIVTLGELIKTGAISIRSGHEVGSEAYGSGDIPFIRTSDINNFEISSDPTNSVSEDVYLQYCSQQNLSEGDILFIADGRYRIGKTAILNKYNKKCIIQSHIDIISVSENSPIMPYELLYLLNLESVQEQIRSLVFIQSTLGTLGPRIREIKIPIPDRNAEWNEKINVFQSCLETRSELLSKVQKFEHSFEL